MGVDDLFCKRCGGRRDGIRPLASELGHSNADDDPRLFGAALRIGSPTPLFNRLRLVTNLRRWWWLVIVCAAIAAGGAYGVSQIVPKEYDSEARVLVGSLTQANYDQQLAYQQLAQTYVAVANTAPVLERVAARAGLREDPQALADRIDIRAPLGQSVLRVTATGQTPEEAANLANAVAGEIVKLGEAPSGATVAAIVDPAAVPDSPSSPRVVLNTAVATLLGAAVAVLLIYLLPSPATEGSTAADPTGSPHDAIDVRAPL